MDEIMIQLVSVPGGSFLMGSLPGEIGRLLREGPQHLVTVPPFYIGKFTVTQGQWRVVAGFPRVETDLKPEPSYFKGDDRPVEQVSWEDAVEFCARLAEATGEPYRLPTEAEWEYACRGGTTTPFAFGETITTEFVNYNGNYPYGEGPKGEYRDETVVVGSLGVANGFGLYDMHGNVREWCQDVLHESYDGAPTDGSAWEKGGDQSFRMVRGGSRFSVANCCRSAYRCWYSPDYRFNGVGFRVVVAAQTPAA